MQAVILSSLALKGVLEKLRPKAELKFDATQAILQRVAKGERADLLILTREALDGLVKKGAVTAFAPLGSSGVGVAVRMGAPRPDIRSKDAFVRALLSARSVAHSKVGASGLHFRQLIEELGIAANVRTLVIERGPVGVAVARGQAELGIQQLCELAPVPGISIVGPLPAPYQVMTHFYAGIPAGAVHMKSAMSIIELLRSPAARSVMLGGGMKPAA